MQNAISLSKRQLTLPWLCKETQSWTPVKVVKTNFIQEILKHKKRDLSTELGSILNTRKSVNYIVKEQVVWSVDGKLLVGDIRARGNSG